MINRTKEIQRIIDENGYSSYLEIGLGNLSNFNAIQCNYKVGVDPEFKNQKPIDKKGNLHDIVGINSDYFFDNWKSDSFDCIFIDGLHHAEQVEKDIINSWNCLNKGGQIIIHDVKPLDEKCQRVPREQTQWTGNVWRAWYGLKKAYPKLKLDYIDERVGLAIIHKSRHKIEPGFIDWETTYEEYDKVKGWEV